MILTTITLTELDAGERDDLQMLLADPEWVDREFLAIMQASGLADSLATRATPRPAFPAHDGPGGREAPVRMDRHQERQINVGTRVRSPPADHR